MADVQTFERLGWQGIGRLDVLRVGAGRGVDFEGCPQRVGLQELCADRGFEPRLVQLAAQLDDIAQMIVEITLALAECQADFLLCRGKRARVYVTHKSHPFFRCVSFRQAIPCPFRLAPKRQMRN